MQPDIGQSLILLRVALQRHSASSDLDGLAPDLVDHLVKLHHAGRLTGPFLRLALDALKEMPDVQALIEPLMQWATEQSSAAGYRDARSAELPWIASVHGEPSPSQP